MSRARASGGRRGAAAAGRCSAPGLLAALLALAACGGPAADTGAASEVSGSATGGSATGGSTGGAAPADRDSDGSPEDEDCDDLDPRRAPGLEEQWDGIDNDCDGAVDADGEYRGSVSLSAGVTYEGVGYRWSFDCPAELSRGDDTLSLAVTCRPEDPEEQERIDQLLGEELGISIYPGDEAVEGASWAGWVVFSSSEGWDSEGQATLDWAGMDSAQLDVALESVWLDISGGGAVLRE